MHHYAPNSRCKPFHILLKGRPVTRARSSLDPLRRFRVYHLQLEDGTCTYVFQPDDAEPYKGTVGGFISQTLRWVCCSRRPPGCRRLWRHFIDCRIRMYSAWTDHQRAVCCDEPLDLLLVATNDSARSEWALSRPSLSCMPSGVASPFEQRAQT